MNPGALDAVEVPAMVEPTIKVSRMYRNGKSLVREEADAEPIEVRKFDGNVAKVEFSARTTINLGNYESVQIGVSVSLPTYVEELEECYQAAKQFVDLKLNAEVAAVREAQRSRRYGD